MLLPCHAVATRLLFSFCGVILGIIKEVCAMDQILSPDSSQPIKARALTRLLKELEQGETCEQSYSEEQAAGLLGVKG